jgi:hypothetical protein
MTSIPAGQSYRVRPSRPKTWRQTQASGGRGLIASKRPQEWAGASERSDFSCGTPSAPSRAARLWLREASSCALAACSHHGGPFNSSQAESELWLAFSSRTGRGSLLLSARMPMSSPRPSRPRAPARYSARSFPYIDCVRTKLPRTRLVRTSLVRYELSHGATPAPKALCHCTFPRSPGGGTRLTRRSQ